MQKLAWYRVWYLEIICSMLLLSFLIAGISVAMIFGQTCEERGGERVFSHMHTKRIGNNTIHTEIYKCEVQDANSN